MRRRPRSGCLRVAILLGGFILLTMTVVSLMPLRTTILILGIDRTPSGTVVGRSDSMILMRVAPSKPTIGMLSIPRDLWVTIPGEGENRINTAHFFAENEEPGSGPSAAVETVRLNFGVDVDHYIRIQFEGLIRFVDGLGGIPIELAYSTSKFSAGPHHLDGETALAFVRDRTGGDDFVRMSQGQLFIRATLKHMLDPRTWPRIPGALIGLLRFVDSNIPPWKWIGILTAYLRVGADGIEMVSIDRSMVQGVITENGAQVLLPNWPAIKPLLLEWFGP